MHRINKIAQHFVNNDGKDNDVMNVKIDWSTKEAAQQYLNNLALKFKKAVEEDGYNWGNALEDFDENVVDFNPFNAYNNRRDLVNDLNEIKGIKSDDVYFDIVTWSKDQLLIRNTYIYRSNDDQILAWRSNVLAKLNEKGKISHWIYIMNENMKKEIVDFFGSL